MRIFFHPLPLLSLWALGSQSANITSTSTISVFGGTIYTSATTTTVRPAAIVQQPQLPKNLVTLSAPTQTYNGTLVVLGTGSMPKPTPACCEKSSPRYNTTACDIAICMHRFHAPLNITTIFPGVFHPASCPRPQTAWVTATASLGRGSAHWGVSAPGVYLPHVPTSSAVVVLAPPAEPTQTGVLGWMHRFLEGPEHREMHCFDRCSCRKSLFAPLHAAILSTLPVIPQSSSHPQATVSTNLISLSAYQYPDANGKSSTIGTTQPTTSTASPTFSSWPH